MPVFHASLLPAGRIGRSSRTYLLSADLLIPRLRPERLRTEPTPEPELHRQVERRRAGWLSSWLGPRTEAEPPPAPQEPATVAEPVSATRVLAGGIVYTSLLDPTDSRTNWTDLVTAFCLAFRDAEDATLVLGMLHQDPMTYLSSLVQVLCQLSPFKCRVIASHGDLGDPDYAKLIEATAYYVNSSHCEAVCFPLMEFMASGTPAVAPEHSSMADYVDASIAFVVRSNLEPDAWPDDPRELYRTTSHRPHWESLLGAFRASYAMAKGAPESYSRMAARARQKMEDYCSGMAARDKLLRLFAPSRDSRNGLPRSAAALSPLIEPGSR